MLKSKKCISSLSKSVNWYLLQVYQRVLIVVEWMKGRLNSNLNILWINNHLHYMFMLSRWQISSLTLHICGIIPILNGGKVVVTLCQFIEIPAMSRFSFHKLLQSFSPRVTTDRVDLKYFCRFQFMMTTFLTRCNIICIQ